MIRSEFSPSKYQSGQLVRILKNETGHNFSIGSTVILDQYSHSANDWSARSPEGFWFLREDEFEAVYQNIRVVNRSNNPLPTYATKGSVGMDLHLFSEEPITLEPLQRSLVGTGIYLEIPSDMEVQIRPRSGLAYKHGVTVLNAPGTIDSDYRGEIKVLLINLSGIDHTIQPGDRIAQMVFSKYEKISLLAVESLEDTERGEGGFGHTGI
jgi:dUTP pyrophosphatase